MKDKELALCLLNNSIITEEEYQHCDYCSMIFNEKPNSRCLTSELSTKDKYNKLFKKALRNHKLKRILCQ